MIVVNYLVAAALFCTGLYTVLSRRNLVKIVMGLSLMESSTYLLLVSMAYRKDSTAPVLVQAPKGSRFADPVLQNFCLTAIVIGVAVTAVFLTVVVRVAQHYRTLDADEMRALRG
ncbi:MAG: sodium:proton antiporter [Mycobacteriales bacterium]